MEKVYRYKGKIYSEAYYTDETRHYDGDLSDLLYVLSRDHPNIYREETMTIRYVGDEYYGTDEDTSNEDVIENLIWQGYEEIEEEGEDESNIS